MTITVTPVNDAPPVAVDDAYTTVEDTLLTVDAPGVLDNDYDVDGDDMTVTLRTNVSHGTLILLSDGSFTYQPDQDFFGTDSFTYTLLTHPHITSGWTDWATVTITVTPLSMTRLFWMRSLTRRFLKWSNIPSPQPRRMLTVLI